MRVSLVKLLCTIGLTLAGATGACAGDKADIEKELRKFQGTWTLQTVKTGGKEQDPADFKAARVTFQGDKYTVRNGDEVIQTCTQKLDPSKSPKAIDVTVTDGLNKEAAMLGIYEINGNTLKVCFDPEGKKRPTEFKGASGSQTLVIHKRLKK